MSTFLQLPPELIEHILVDTVCGGAPNTVAAVAACCRLLHDLVHSIWRDLFLAVFDDPRPKNALKASGPGLDAPIPLTHDWWNFVARIAAANRLAAADPACDFAALVDVVATVAPIPQARPVDPVPVQVQRRAIVFPPLLRERLTSNNTSWLNEAFAKGYPPLLAKRMLEYFDPEGPEYVRPEFEDTAPGKAFSKFTFLRGFIPTETEEAAAAVEHRRARSMARCRVYNTKYLMPERCWGPFQPLDPTQSHVYIWRNRLLRRTDSQNAAKALRSSSSRGPHSLNPSSIVLTPLLLDPDEDIDDPDYDPDASDSEDGNAHPHGDGSYLLNFLSSRGIDFTDNRTYPTYLFPAPHRVVPDYAFLAAARYIMEANMREMFSMQPYRLLCKQAAADVGRDPTKIVDAMQSLELLRMGGAPGFWEVWRPEISEEEEEEHLPPPPADDKGKGKAASSDEVDGWDWAGVEGQWRRVVCWLDYRELLMHNVDIDAAGFSSDDVQETMRIFPLNLRVARYSRPPTPPAGADPQALIWRLPVIHVEGDSLGTDTDETSRRVVEGTVRMIGDGAVRWSMTSSEAAGLDPEWVTESVQVGDIGSAVGIIGLWTGAEHSSTDPLGPCWAWKVA
ncbi:hypothetical protein C8F04DRAFT_1076502 [Mycena alexandri]|uniref:F-box domain-containing protein n=1 Tax=Mycena alexandri TaxID=1745969 RepID=A0AAD6XC56_9AGAR|nr:hypothetical protein C8F04DRAFT_1076502 [Mycena alexandri]